MCKNSGRKKSFENKIFRNLFLVFACLMDHITFAQIMPAELDQILSDKIFIQNAEIKNPSAVKEFYTYLNYQTTWIQSEDESDRNILFSQLGIAAELGLNEKDYQFQFIRQFHNGTKKLKSRHDSLEAEICITDAAIHFYTDLIYGNITPNIGFNGLKYSPGCVNIPELLAASITTKKLQFFLNPFAPSLPEITALEKRIGWYLSIMADSNFTEETAISGYLSHTNKKLLLKLYQLAVIDSTNKKLSDSILKEKVKIAQRQFDLVADGVLRGATLKHLNIPLAARLDQLKTSLNYYRWLRCLTKQQIIVVNIPSTYMKIYRDNKVVAEMRMIVGKKSTPTPTLTSIVDEVILYPYWHVPYSIATKELLPLIKKDPGYIDAGNYQILDKNGKIMNPYSINWQSLSTNFFPYTIRQSTGCDNALGLLKLNFYNPYGVYLHDTPTKNLFKRNKRFFSHGCMRMEKPMELGHLVLKNNGIAIDTLEQKGCLRNQSPIVVKADEKIPVVVWYNPAGIDSTGAIIFYEDIYEKFKHL